MVYCQNCGREMPENSNFCANCGARLKTQQIQRKGWKPIRTLVFLSVIIATFACSWYLLQPKTTAAPDFSLTDLNGSAFRLSDYKGKAVVIDFMATWCGPCRMQMSNLKVIWEKYGGKIVLMSIDIDPGESKGTLTAFAQEFAYATWIWARDTANLAEVYQVTAIPKTVVIDRNGYIRFVHVGVTDSTTLIQEIDQLIG